MSDLIERNDLVEILKDTLEEGYVDSYTSHIRKEIFDEVFEVVEDKEMTQTVDAIPVEWIKKYAEEHRAYIHEFKNMLAEWAERKEE